MSSIEVVATPLNSRRDIDITFQREIRNITWYVEDNQEWEALEPPLENIIP
jgi:hypothetical protein